MFSLLAGLLDYYLFKRQREYNILIVGVEKVQEIHTHTYTYTHTHTRKKENIHQARDINEYTQNKHKTQRVSGDMCVCVG